MSAMSSVLMMSVASPPIGPAMTGVVTVAAFMMAGGVLSGANRAGVAFARRDGSYNREQPSCR
jgi:hypothetical protein